MQQKLFSKLLFAAVLMLANITAFSQEKPKSLEETLGALKKSFKPDKAFIFPAVDSNNTIIRTFAEKVAAVEGVKKVSFQMKDNSTYILLDTKNSMISVWNKLPADFRTGYRITERLPEGFKMANTNTQSVTTNPGAETSGESAYDKAVRETNETYKPSKGDGKSVWQQQQDHAEELRQRNKNWSMNITEYDNDTVVYKTFPKPPSGKFLEYTVNGKKFSFQDNAKSMDNTATFHAYQGIPLSKNGLKIQIQPSTVTTLMTFDIFYPLQYPKSRGFHFGADSTKNENVPTEKVTPHIQMELFAELVKLSDWGIQRSPKERIEIYNRKKENGMDDTNIESGYMQILFFETGAYGTVEVVFKFKTKPYTNKDGKQIKAATVEGRFRAKGNFPGRR
jgi:hypothetical protein